MRALSLLAVLVAADAFPRRGNSSDEVVQAMIVDLLKAGGREPDGSGFGNKTSTYSANATDVVAGNLTEDRSAAGGMLRDGDVNDVFHIGLQHGKQRQNVNGYDNHWWQIAPNHTRVAFKECCMRKGTMDKPCTNRMCTWEATRWMEIGRPITLYEFHKGGITGNLTDGMTNFNMVMGDHRCIEDLRQLADYLYCFAAGQDNTDCCNAAGVKTQACLDLCAGTLPPEGMNSRAFRDCSEAGNGEERKVGLCSVHAYVEPVTRATPVFPTLECLHTVTKDMNGTMVASCV